MRRDIFLSVLFSLLCGEPPYAQLAIDVHSHIIPAEYTALLARHNAELEETFPLPRWDADSHLAFMDEAGIGCAILTLPAPQPFYGDVRKRSLHPPGQRTVGTNQGTASGTLQILRSPPSS